MLKMFAYSLVRFVPDVVRGEAVNLGVVAVCEEARSAGSRFLSRYTQRVHLLDPGCDVAALQPVLDSLGERFTTDYQPALYETESGAITTRAGLAGLASVLANQVQLSQPKLYRGASLDSVLDQLYRDLVAPPATKEPATQHMTVGRIRELIKVAIKEWSNDVVRLEESTAERAEVARHFADFWLTLGSPAAAFIAIPDDPAEYRDAWTRRDALPTMAMVFRRQNPDFKAVAVFPPRTNGDAEFLAETKSFLGSYEGIIVTSVDGLPALREELVPQLR